MNEPALRRSRKPIVAVGLALAAAAAGAVYIALPKSSEHTDNAYIRADSTVVAPKVRGLVARVIVTENQPVRAGMPLVQLDSAEFDTRLAAAQAQLADAQAKELAARAALATLASEEALARSAYAATRTNIAAADAQQSVADADSARFADLARSGYVSRQAADQLRSAAVTARAEAERARAQLRVSRDQIAVTGARRAELEAALSQAVANVAAARASKDLALQDRAHTLIRAPIDGVVADRQVEQGAYVQPGSRLLSIVPVSRLYVIANFKETQTGRMQAGQAATVEVDALPGVALRAHIESLAPGSGSQFALLPFEPGTGNFTKIVQRVPVRLSFDPGQTSLARLRPGLSSTVTVRLDESSPDTDAKPRDPARIAAR